ncbi:PhzF family phenazine biosynthesis protein [Herbidospora galbida]|uniref:PhzF family phenazine biosynthesis protein n=1 Tax=Herbidospora galbida TaxID=2575442 RepID=A0A4V5UYJ4_9ACTN|nr:PhzF family phenazine biosynthesis protein [Herbidospora galbida]
MRACTVDSFTDQPFKGNPTSFRLLEGQITRSTMSTIVAEMRHSLNRLFERRINSLDNELRPQSVTNRIPRTNCTDHGNYPCPPERHICGNARRAPKAKTAGAPHTPRHFQPIADSRACRKTPMTPHNRWPEPLPGGKHPCAYCCRPSARGATSSRWWRSPRNSGPSARRSACASRPTSATGSRASACRSPRSAPNSAR